MGRILMRNIITVLMLALLVACVPTTPGVNNTPTDVPTDTPETPWVDTTNQTTTQEQTSARFTINGTEGDLIQLRPEAIDPDGDALSYTFTAPFDQNGNWQTQIGDEGEYDVNVAVSDSKSTTTETVRVIVRRANRAPTIVCREIIVNEGEMVDIRSGCDISDEENEEVVVTYSGWMTGRQYRTTYEDAGAHVVTITGSDPTHTVMQNVTIVVQNTNRPPVFNDAFPSTIGATENDVITLPSDLIADPDRDPVTITYSAPFDERGVWRTRIGDAGTYDVDVVASDGQTTVKRTVTITIGLLNTAPVLRTIPDLTVREGETIRIPIDATDREGDRLTTTISGFMTTDTYKTDYDDAGSYTVRITVTDGEFTADQVVDITVVDVNRPPAFVTPA